MIADAAATPANSAFARSCARARACRHAGRPNQTRTCLSQAEMGSMRIGRYNARDEQRQDPLIGQVLDGRYRIETVLGEGGMGLVYKAVHTTLGKPLAIKVLRPEVSKNEEIVERFRQEAQSASPIGNQHIIDISDFGELPDGSTYFVMEFLDGRSLTRRARAGAASRTERTIHIAQAALRARSARRTRSASSTAT